MKKLISSIGVLICINSPLPAQTPSLKLPANKTSACCGFSAYNSTTLPMAAKFGVANPIVFDKKKFDDANAFNTLSYVAPSDGVYQFFLTIGLAIDNASSNTSQILCTIKTNLEQSASKTIQVSPNFKNNSIDNFSAIFKLKTGEEVSVTLMSLDANTKAITTGNFSVFSGSKLY